MMFTQVISEVFSENEMSSAKVAEMFAEADVDGNGRVRENNEFLFSDLKSELAGARCKQLCCEVMKSRSRVDGEDFGMVGHE